MKSALLLAAHFVKIRTLSFTSMFACACIIMAVLAMPSTALACTGYAKKIIHLGDYSSATTATSAIQQASRQYFYCSCGSNWISNGKRHWEISDCRSGVDYSKYNTSKYVELRVSAPLNGCPAGMYIASNGKCENFKDPTNYGAGECWGKCGGNPIDFSNGIKIQYETDYSAAPQGLLKYARVYSSQTGKWIFPFEQKIIQIKKPAPILADKPVVNSGVVSYVKFQVGYAADEYVTISRPNGSVYLFSRLSERTSFYDSRGGVSGSLKKTGSGWDYLDGMVTETYNEQGILTGMHSPTDRISIAYDISGSATYTDSRGNSITRTPLENNDFKISNNAGFEVSYIFSEGKLVTVMYPDGTSVKYHHGESGFPMALTGITDEENKRYATWDYNNNGKAIMSMHANNAGRIDLVYGSNNTVVETGISGKKTSYQFDLVKGKNRILKIQEHATASSPVADTHYSYDENDFHKTVTDKNGNVTETLRNKQGWVTSSRTGLRWVSGVNSTLLETPASQKTVTTWHAYLALPLLQTYYGWNGKAYEAYRSEATTYTSNNRIATFTVKDLTAITQPYTTNGRTRTWTYAYTYQDAGQSRLLQQTVDGPRININDSVTYNHDESGRLYSIVNALGHTTLFSDYNNREQVGTITDANGNVRNITYTARGWLDTLSVNGAAFTDYDYYANGLLQKVTLPDGSWLSYTYNDARHLIQVQNNLGESIHYTPNIADGQWTQRIVKSSSQAIVSQRQRIFDELGRVMTLQGQNGQAWRYTYDKNDNLKTESDALEQITGYNYDSQNRISETLDPEQHAKEDPATKNAIAFAYDLQGNLKSLTDQRGNTTHYLYDGFGELIQQNSPDTGITVFRYDAAGNITGKTDAQGISAAYQYDALNRLLAVDYLGRADEAVTFAYDNTSQGNKGLGKLTAYSSNKLQTTFSYDSWGLSAKTECVFHVQCYITRYQRNTIGQLIENIYPSGNKVLYGYNALGQVDNVKWQFAGQHPSQATVLANQIVYRPLSAGIQQMHYGNGVENQFLYDADDRLKNIIATGVSGILYGKGYQYTLNNNISTINDALYNTKIRHYTYDKNSRLTSDIQGAGITAKVTTYSYDETGNRTGMVQATGLAATATTGINETLTYAAENNRLLGKEDAASNNNIMYQYDARGNITAVVASATGSINYSYNAANRLEISNALAGDITQYTLNAVGQRQIKMRNGDASESIWYSYNNQGQLIAEHNLDTQQVQAEYVYLNGLPLAYVLSQNGNNAIYNVISDHLATPQILLDENQSIVWQADYDAFGAATLPIEQVTFNLRFPGQYYDKETGLHYNYYRDYDPSLGRYVQSDPIGLAGGINTYGYVGGNPVSRIDPLGLSWTCFYEISSGHIVCYDDETEAETYRDTKCYAGNGKDKNNKDSTNVPFKGPLPPGEWDVGKTPYNDPRLGSYVVKLTPSNINNGLFGPTGDKRQPDTFRFHGDSTRHPGQASEGCLICSKNTRKAIVENDGGGAVIVVY